MLGIGPPARPELRTVHTRLSKGKTGDHLYSFTIKVERAKDGDAEVFQFRVTAKPKNLKAPRLPCLSGALEVFDGKRLVSVCDVRRGGRDGQLSFSFRVAARYAEKSRFTFAETLGEQGEGQGFYYWFYLKDFAEPEPV
jgi:hypothetical protein